MRVLTHIHRELYASLEEITGQKDITKILCYFLGREERKNLHRWSSEGHKRSEPCQESQRGLKGQMSVRNW